MMQNTKILGIPVTISTLVEVAESIAGAATAGSKGIVCVADVNSILTARRNGSHLDALSEAMHVTTDGMPLVWMLHALGHKSAERVSGTELVHAVCAKTSGTVGHYFYGGTEGISHRVGSELECRHRIRVVGTESPPFGCVSEKEKRDVRQRITDAKAQIVWVGLGCPKQEAWMLENAKYIDAILIGVGAAFDFIADEKKRAPVWMRRHGLEWLHRLASEPRRLWRRYITVLVSFIPIAIWELAKHRFGLIFLRTKAGTK